MSKKALTATCVVGEMRLAVDRDYRLLKIHEIRDDKV
jgi:hypothetical protein